MENFGISSNHFQSGMSNPENVSRLLAGYLTEKKDEAANLLRVNGISVNALSTQSDIRLAYLKAIKDSDQFRSSASTALTKFVQSITDKSNFVDNLGFCFVDNVDTRTGVDNLSFVNNDDHLNTIGIAPTTINPNYASGVTSTTAPSTTTTKTGFWSSLGNIFTPEVIQTGVKTGLGALSTKLQSDANASSEANALRLEELRLQQMQAQAEINKTSPASKMSTGAKVAIGVGVAALVGTVIWLAVRK